MAQDLSPADSFLKLVLNMLLTSSTQRGPTEKIGRDSLWGECSNSTNGHGFKLKEGRFRLDIKK